LSKTAVIFSMRSELIHTGKLQVNLNNFVTSINGLKQGTIGTKKEYITNSFNQLFYSKIILLMEHILLPPLRLRND